MKELLIITGPTATGKSALAVECAQAINGEIISADSMQIYKALDIGTAKITREEMQGVPHHLIDIIEPWESFSVAEYQSRAIQIIEDIRSRGKVPVIAGGTGLYINSILYPMQFAQREDIMRIALRAELEDKGKEFMYEKLKILDPQSYNKLHVNDTKRVLRAIEICLSGGERRTDDINKPRYDALIIVLSAERKLLYDRINMRVDSMIEQGLLDEVKSQFANNCNAQSFQAIGYKELAEYLRGNCAYPEAVELLKKNTRNYAKRQLTWARQYADAVWLDWQDREKALKLAKETFANEQK